jgi:hypothetical protein
MIFMPESPRWLSKEGDEVKARGIMHNIYKPQCLEPAINQLNKEVEQLKIET